MRNTRNKKNTTPLSYPVTKSLNQDIVKIEENHRTRLSSNYFIMHLASQALFINLVL